VSEVVYTAAGTAVTLYAIAAGVAAWVGRPTVVWSARLQRWVAARSRDRFAP
jgi:hypothetical protein